MSFATSPVNICAHCNRPIGNMPTILGGNNYHYECTQSPYARNNTWVPEPTYGPLPQQPSELNSEFSKKLAEHFNPLVKKE